MIIFNEARFNLDLRNNAKNISLLSLMITNINNQEDVKRHLNVFAIQVTVKFIWRFQS